MEDPTKYKQEVTKMKEYKDDIKYCSVFVILYSRKERQILMIKLHLRDWCSVLYKYFMIKLKNHRLIIDISWIINY